MMDSAASVPRAENSSSNGDCVHKRSGATIQVELAVDIKEQSQLDKIRQTLKGEGIKLVSSNLEARTIQIDLGNGQDNCELRNVQTLQEFIENQLGFLTVVKGLGRLSSAVAELRPSVESSRKGRQVMGLVRLSQLENDQCYVDASISGPTGEGTKVPAHYTLAIHEFGDLNKDNLDSIGAPSVNIVEQVHDDQDQVIKISARKIIEDCNVASMIGRSIGITQYDMDGPKRILSAGVIARASTIASNNKKLCSCSGRTIWEERLEANKHRPAS